jgi:hypothetical protein
MKAHVRQLGPSNAAVHAALTFGDNDYCILTNPGATSASHRLARWTELQQRAADVDGLLHL